MCFIVFHKDLGSSLADRTGATTSLPWDFLQKVLVIFAKGSSDFLQVPEKGKFPEQKRVQVKMWVRLGLGLG